METKQFDVVVVGGGLAGLAAAALLAKRGERVLLLEQSKSPGGRARTNVHNGFHFNLGAHALYRSGPAESVLKELGVPYRGSAPPLNGQLALNEGALHIFPTGAMSMLTTDLLSLPAKLEAGRMLASIGRIKTEPVMDVPLAKWLEAQVSHPEVRNLLLAVSRLTTYANAPDKLSAGTAIRQLQMALGGGVLYLDGGWQTLVDGLRQAAERAGAVIETGSRVEAIECDGAGRAAGVRLAAGERVAARAVLIAASPSVASSLVGPGVPELHKRSQAAIPVQAASMDVALERLPRPRALFALGIDKPLYFSVHSASARLAPAGAALIHMIWYRSQPDQNHAAQSKRESADQIRSEFEALLDLIQPDWRGLLIHNEFLPDLVVSNALPEARTRGTLGWPEPRIAEMPGLFLAGDWIGNSGVLADASLGSARAAVNSIIGSQAGAAIAV
jgi:phytoene dehydrogenase-like protein